MKRFVSLFLAVITVLLCGCSPKEKDLTVADLIGRPFGCKMDIYVLGVEFSGEFVKNSNESMSLLLSEPELLNGLTFGYENGQVSASMFGLTVEIDTEGTPSASASETLFDLYSEKGENEIALSETKILLVNTSDRGVSTIEFDRETLMPEKMYNSRSGIEIVYSDYHLLEE